MRESSGPLAGVTVVEVNKDRTSGGRAMTGGYEAGFVKTPAF
jgi:hypothetical protein